MRKLNPLVGLIIATLAAACGPVETPPGRSASAADAAVSIIKADAASALASEAAPAAAANTATSTSTVTSTATPAGTVTASNDASMGINITFFIVTTDTTTDTASGTDTGTKTSAAIAIVPDAGTANVADAKPTTSPEADPPSKPDAANIVENDAPLACVPNPSGEICGNGLDDNCNGLIDEGCPTPDPVAAPKPAPIDQTAPTVALPVCSLADTTSLPAGVAIPFYAAATDDTFLLACAFYLNANKLGIQSVTGKSLTLEQDITLPVGTSTIFVICSDAAGNEGQSVALTVKAVSSDAGVQLKADALPSADTKPAADTFVAAADTQVSIDTTPTPIPDAGTDTLVVSTDAAPQGDAGSAGCFALVNNQYITVPYGQAIVCAAGSLSGSQTCKTDGTLTECTATGTVRSNLRTVVNCRLDKVVLSGDVVDGLFPMSSDTTALTDICLVGDGVQDVYGNGGMIATNRTHCLPYHSDSSYQYVFTDLTFGAALYRITFFGVTVQGATTQLVRWMNDNPDLGLSGTNGIPIMVSDPNNLCAITRKIVYGETAKLVVNGTGTPLTQ